jgi:hypothetical protein
VSEGTSANPALRLSFTVGVRHEVVQVAVETAISSELTAIWQDSTRWSATGILPRRASSGKPFPPKRWRGAKPSGQKYPASYGAATEPRGKVATASIRRSGARIAWYG